MLRARPRPPRRLLLALAVTVTLAACTSGDPSEASGPTSSAPSAATSPSTSAGTSATPSATATTTPTAPAIEASAAPTSAPADPGTGGSTRATVDVTLTFSGWLPDTSSVEAGSYVTGVIESGGTCTLELVRGGSTVTASGPGAPDAAGTTCGALAVPGSSLTSGTWSVSVSYVSPTAAGRSAAVEVEVP